jgi:hypothetical protein
MPMPRYFKSSTVSRAVSSSAGAFIFEPSIPMGGGWLGVLAVAEPTASVLAADLPQSVWEISEEEFNGIKKKAPGTLTDWQPSPPRRQNQEALVVAAPADRLTNPTRPESARVIPLDSVTLATTRKQPPVEPLLEMASDKLKRGKRAA